MLSEGAFSQTVELLERAKAGDATSLARVLERYRERLLLRIRLMMGSRVRRGAESGDFLQEVFVDVLEHFDGFELRDERSFLRWTTMIARNHIRMDIRHERTIALESIASASGVRPLRSTDASPLETAQRVEQIARVVDVLAELPEEHRSVLELRHFEQLPFVEIGRRIGRTENAAQLLHARVLLNLGDQLEAGDGA